MDSFENKSPLTVLVIEDYLDQREVLEIMLQREGYRVISVGTAEEALERLETEEVQIALSDVMLPRMSGFELIRRIRSNPRFRNTYLIIVTARIHEGDLVRGLDLGADDYVAKPFSRLELLARVRVGARMVEYQKRLENQALVDPMTGLLNRRGFEKKMEEEFERTKRYLHPLSLLVIDVDDFKTINDMYGHLEGDNVLRKIAKCFSDKIRRSDFPARYGGEEFVVILSETEMAKALVVAQKIATEIKRCNFGPVTGPVSVSVSIGVSSISPGGEWPQWRQILEEADQALYRAKRNGKGRVECFCSGVIEKPNRELV